MNPYRYRPRVRMTVPYTCPVCGEKLVSKNALGRSGHERGKRHQAALEAEVAKQEARERLRERRP